MQLNRLEIRAIFNITVVYNIQGTCNCGNHLALNEVPYHVPVLLARALLASHPEQTLGRISRSGKFTLIVIFSMSSALRARCRFVVFESQTGFPYLCSSFT